MLLFESDPSSVPPFLSFFLSLGPFLNDDCKVSGFLGPLVTVTIPQSPSLPSTFGYPIQCRHHLNMAPFSVSLSPSSRSHLPPPCSSLTLLACLVWWARAPPAHHHCTQGCQMAKCEPFLSLDCTRVKGGGRNPRKGRDQILPSGNLECNGGGLGARAHQTRRQASKVRDEQGGGGVRQMRAGRRGEGNRERGHT